MRTHHEDDISLVELWRILRDGRVLIAVTTAVVLAAVILASLVMTETYTAEVMVADVDADTGANIGGIGQGALGALTSLSGLDLLGGKGRRESHNIIASRGYIEEFIRRNDLLPVLFESDELPPMWEAAELFREDHFSFEAIPEMPGVYRLKVRWSDPVEVADWANQLVALVNEMTRAHDTREATASIEYLNAQLEQTSIVEMTSLLYGLLENEHRKLMLANVRSEYAFRVIDPAVVPTKRSWPHRSLMAVVGLILGLVLGVVVAFGAKLARDVRTLDERLRQEGV